MLLQPAARPRRRQQRLNQRPLLVGQVRGVPPLSRHPATLMASTFMVTQTRKPKIQKLLKHALAAPPHYVSPAPDHVGFAVPLRLRCEDGELRLITTLTSFATALDVTLAELHLEAYLPADEPTAHPPPTPPTSRQRRRVVPARARGRSVIDPVGPSDRRPAATPLAWSSSQGSRPVAARRPGAAAMS
jgi:hypothetical protein